METVTLERIGSEGRAVLERYLQFELYEVGLEPGPAGLIDWGESLDPFFSNGNHVALFFKTDGEFVGFALAKPDRPMRWAIRTRSSCRAARTC